jgi:hypothetical protein
MGGAVNDGKSTALMGCTSACLTAEVQCGGCCKTDGSHAPSALGCLSHALVGGGGNLTELLTLGPSPQVLEEAIGRCGAVLGVPGGTRLRAPGPAPGGLTNVRRSCPSSATTIVSGSRHAGQTANTSSTACGYGADLHLHEAQTRNLGGCGGGGGGCTFCGCRGTHCAAALGEMAALSKSRIGAER